MEPSQNDPLIITSRLPDPKLGKNTHPVLILQCPMPSRFSHVQLFATPWTVAHQTPLSMGFSRQEHWSGLPCPPPGDIPGPGITLTSPASPELGGGFFLLVWCHNQFPDATLLAGALS